MKKLLFIHTEIVWYRITLFKEISKLLYTNFVFSKVEEKTSDYAGLKSDKKQLDNLNICIFNDKGRISWRTIRKSIIDDYDFLMTPYPDSPDLKIESLLCSIFAKIRKKKVCLYWERWIAKDQKLSFKEKFKRFLLLLYIKLLSLFVDCFLVPGTNSKNLYLQLGIKQKRIKEVYNASLINECGNKINIRKKYNIENNKKIILFFGRVVRIKGLDILIKAFEKIKNNSCVLLVCGDGDEMPKCREYVMKNNIKNIIFVGLIQPKDRYSYYSQSDVFVLPNRFLGTLEAWGLSINEAMQFGLPIIATNATGASKDLIQNDYNGYVVEQENIEELRNAIERIIESPNIRKMGENSKIIISKYNYENQAKLIVKAFLE